MPHAPIRFLHASDFHLEQMLYGVEEVPEHLQTLFIEAPYRAAQRVFDLAIEQGVDFVVLSGDLLHLASAPPRSAVFLVQQFERLDSHGIQVYWSGGSVDVREAWPAALVLPDNVHRFAGSGIEQFTFEKDGFPLVQVLGCGRHVAGMINLESLQPSLPGVFGIAALHTFERPQHHAHDAVKTVDYWALGGDHTAETWMTHSPVARSSGSPQGRCPHESGPHGCTLVNVDMEGNIQLQPHSTDVVRWLRERVRVDSQNFEVVETQLRHRCQMLLDTAPDMPHLVEWTITGWDVDFGRSRHLQHVAPMLGRLRDEFGHLRTPVWSTSLELEPAPGRVSQHRLDDETMLGDFLRMVDQVGDATEESPFELDREARLAHLPAEHPLRAAAQLPQGAQREAWLKQVALLGMDLLAGEDPWS